MVTIEEFRKIELIIAQIKEVKVHPNADKLYVLKIDTGKEEKQLVAGIRMAYTPEELVGKRVVVVNNLQPAVIRGEEAPLCSALDGLRTLQATLAVLEAATAGAPVSSTV